MSQEQEQELKTELEATEILARECPELKDPWLPCEFEGVEGQPVPPSEQQYVFDRLPINPTQRKELYEKLVENLELLKKKKEQLEGMVDTLVGKLEVGAQGAQGGL